MIDELKKQLAEAIDCIKKQEGLIAKLKSQIPCPECHGRGGESRYCTKCEVVCSAMEVAMDNTCIECKTEVTVCPKCGGTGMKYPPPIPA